MSRIRMVDILIYITLYLSLTAAYPPRKNKKLCYLSIPFFVAASMGIILLEEMLPSGNTLIYLLLFILMGSVFGMVFLSGRFAERLVLVCMFTCTFSFINGIAIWLNRQFWPDDMSIWRFLTVPFMVLGGYVSFRFALKSRHGLPWFCWLPIILTALLSLVLNMIRPEGTEILVSPEWLRYHAICSVFSLCIVYLTFFACSRITKYYERSLQAAVNEKMMDSQKHLVEESMRLNRELNRQRHEYNHTLTTAQALLEQKEYGQLADLLQPHADSGGPAENAIHSGNPVADVILNQKAEEARRLGIPFEADVCLTPELPLTSPELVSLLTNLLDNALEGSRAVDDPFIAIHVYPTRCYLCFSVRNRADCGQLDGENLQTTKTNKEAHGFGLDLIRDIARSHQGVAQFTPGEDGVFLAEVSIYLGTLASGI